MGAVHSAVHPLVSVQQHGTFDFCWRMAVLIVAHSQTRRRVVLVLKDD